MTTGAEPTGSDHAARAFVWAVWILMAGACYWCLFRFGRNIPITEDWLLVPGLTGHDPHFWRSLWAQNNEHRVPFPRLVLLAVLRLAKGDFRAGMVVNVALVAAMAAALIALIRKVRGGRTIYADAFFPVALLHLGNWENLFWGWQATQVIPALLGCVMLYVLVGSPALASPGAAIVAGASVVLLPLSGANGVFFVPFFSAWLVYCAFRQWRSVEPGGRGPVTAGLLVVAAVISVALAAVYFIGYERPEWVPPNPGVIPSLAAAARFLALGLGPVARSSWILSTVAVGVVLTAATVVTVRRVRELEGAERHRASGLLLFAGAFGLFALVVGWGRAGAVVIYGSWPIRYSLLAVPALLAAFFLWTLYAPGRSRTVLPNGLMVAMLLLLPLNTVHGLWWAEWYRQGTAEVEADLRTGTNSATMVARHAAFLHHSLDPIDLANFMVMLASARMGPWVGLIDDPSTVRPLAARTNDRPDEGGLVSKEFRYRRRGAAGVALVWGVDGWRTVASSSRPPGTEVRKNVMRTPMAQSGDNFVVAVRVPRGKSLEYGFLAREAADGGEVWDGDYATRTDGSGVVDVAAREDSDRPARPAPSDTARLIATTVRYPGSVASEVVLVWGVNGWYALRAAVRPGQTEIVNRLMKTRMVRDRDGFVATIDAPPGAKLDYGFTLTKRRGIRDFVSPVWDGPDDHPTIEAGRPIQGKSALLLRDELREAAEGWRVILASIASLLVVWAAMYLLLGSGQPRPRSTPPIPA